MSDADKPVEQRVRERAYELWEQDGRRAGEADKYWEQARKEIEAEIIEEQDRIIDGARDRGKPP